MTQEYAGHSTSQSVSVGVSNRQEVVLSYWFCLTHKAVEPEEGCAHAERLGPYADEAAAQAALERAHARSEAWDNDPNWTDGDRSE